MRVSARRDGVQMVLSVADNGLGFSDHADSSGEGVGLSNLRERIAALYDGQATLTVAQINPDTEITIRVPLVEGAALPLAA